MLLLGLIMPWADGAPGAAPEQFVLDNGCRVLFQSEAHSATVAISALVELRASQESPLRAGIRNLLALRAATPEPDDEHTGAWPPGIRVDSSTTRDYLALLVQCLPQDFPAALALIRWRLFAPELSAPQFEAARRKALGHIEATRGLPTALALSKLVEELYPGQRGAWPVTGSLASLLALDLEQVRQFHRDNFRANALVLSISGDLTAAEVAAQARICFGDLLPGPARLDEEAFSPHPTAGEPQWLTMSGVDTSVVAVGGRAPHLGAEDYPAGAVLVALLGSGMGSRLFQALRAQRSLAYTVQAALTPSVVCGHAYVLATCSQANLEAVRAEIDSQIESVLAGGVTEDEVARARKFVVNSFVLGNQRNRDIAHYLGVFYGSGGASGVQTHQQFAQLIADVSAEQVQKSCAQIFGRRIVVVVEGTGTRPNGLGLK